MHYIYKITNITNNKVYIGQTVNPNRRWKDHQWLSKNKQEQYIHRAMAKYRIESFTFEVIASCITDNVKEIDAIEDEIINQYDSRNKDFGYNIKPGGPSRPGFQQSEETKKKMSENWHKDHPIESIQKTAEANRGRVPSLEQRQKVSEANKGNQFCLGHKQSEETIKKRVASTLGKYGGPRICCISDCNKKANFIIEEKRYCSLHGQRLRDTGSLQLKLRVAVNKGIPMSVDSKAKLSASLKGKTAHNKCKPHKQETIEKLRLLNIGKEPPNKMKFTEEQLTAIQLDKRSLRLIAKDWNVSTTVIQRLKRLK